MWLRVRILWFEERGTRMWAFEVSIRFGKDKGLDTEPPEIYDLGSGLVERADRPMGFTPNEGWEDKR